MSDERIVHLTVTGYVQGVGYRAFLAKAARERGIDGWIRNLDDGRVEGVFVGKPDAIDAILAVSRQGPSEANVDTVTIEDCGPDMLQGHEGFEIR